MYMNTSITHRCKRKKKLSLNHVLSFKMVLKQEKTRALQNAIRLIFTIFVSTSQILSYVTPVHFYNSYTTLSQQCKALATLFLEFRSAQSSGWSENTSFRITLCCSLLAWNECLDLFRVSPFGLSCDFISLQCHHRECSTRRRDVRITIFTNWACPRKQPS